MLPIWVRFDCLDHQQPRFVDQPIDLTDAGAVDNTGMKPEASVKVRKHYIYTRYKCHIYSSSGIVKRVAWEDIYSAECTVVSSISSDSETFECVGFDLRQFNLNQICVSFKL
jgi:hypothetical protein